MWMGLEEFGHLLGVSAAIQLMWPNRAFAKPQRVTVTVSPNQILCRCESGALLPRFERLVSWDAWDNLLEAVTEIQDGLAKIRHAYTWAFRFSNSVFGFSIFTAFLPFADRAVLAIRTRKRLRCQAYERGWPVTPPVVERGAGASTGFVVAAALSAEWFKGLPNTLETVEEFIPEAARPFVTVEWRTEDNLVEVLHADPDGLLETRNFGRWL
jgi:hypothetical protein